MARYSNSSNPNTSVFFHSSPRTAAYEFFQNNESCLSNIKGIAKASGIDKSTIYRIIGGDVNPNVTTLEKLSNFLPLTAEEKENLLSCGNPDLFWQAVDCQIKAINEHYKVLARKVQEENDFDRYGKKRPFKERKFYFKMDEFFSRANLDKQTYYEYKKRKILPNYETTLRICVALSEKIEGKCAFDIEYLLHLAGFSLTENKNTKLDFIQECINQGITSSTKIDMYYAEKLCGNEIRVA